MKALPINPEVPTAGTKGAVIGYPNGGAEQTSPAAVRGSENAYGYNIYNSGYVTRNIVVVSANVIPGDSGGPLVDIAGSVIGLTFASSTVHPDEGYALSVPQITDDINAGRTQTQPVDSGDCVGA
jgi:S1-C subfamily serine protease